MLKSSAANKVTLIRVATILSAVVAPIFLAKLGLGQVDGKDRSVDPSQLQGPSPLQAHTDANLDEYPLPLSRGESGTIDRSPAGGLWLSGNTSLALSDLQWIAGNQPGGVLRLANDGRVYFSAAALARAARVGVGNDPANRQRIASFLSSDEGLRLLAEIIGGPYRYLVSIGRTVQTKGGRIRIATTLNLDNRYDSRINPRRRKGEKADKERPPQGFDSLIAVDPDSRLYNLDQRQAVPQAQVVFHELAEAYARLFLGIDYLPEAGRPGAHQVAVDREIILQRERGRLLVVVTAGRNIDLKYPAAWQHLHNLEKQSESKTDLLQVLRNFFSSHWSRKAAKTR